MVEGAGIGSEATDTVARVAPGPPGGQDQVLAANAANVAQQPIVDNAPPVAQPPPSSDRGPSRHEIMAAIESLPERFITGVKEAFPLPPNNPAPTPANSGGETAQADANTAAVTSPDSATLEPGKRKSFAEWWIS